MDKLPVRITIGTEPDSLDETGAGESLVLAWACASYNEDD